MTNRGPETRVVLIGDTANASFHFVVILFIKILHDVKLHIAPSFRSKTIDRVNVANGFECFAHQYETFFLDLDDLSSGSRVWLQWMPAHRARCRGWLVQEEWGGHGARA